MIRTSWPVLQSFRKFIRLALLLIHAALGLTTLQANEQMTVVQEAEEIPSFKINIDAPQKIRVGEAAVITITASNREDGKAHSKTLNLALFITTNEGTSSENISLRKGKAVVHKTFQNAGTRILTVRHSTDPEDKRRNLASDDITVVLQ